MTNKCKNWNAEQKRALLDSFGGKFYSLDWIKKDGSLRSCKARHMQHSMFTEGHASKAKANPVAHKPGLYTCIDVSNEKWINVSLETLKHVKCGDIDYTFED